MASDDSAPTPREPAFSGGALARNYAWLSIGELAVKICTFLAFTFLGRTLGPARYGDVEFAISTSLFFTLFIQMGLGAWGARELAKAADRADELLGRLVELRVWTSAAAFFAIGALASVVSKSAEARWLLVGYGLSLLELPALTLWFFQGRDAMWGVAGAMLLRQSLFAGLVVGLVRVERPLWVIGMFEIAALGASTLFCSAVLRRMGHPLPLPGWRPRLAWRTFRAAAGIGFATLAWAGMWFLPLSLYGWMRADDSVGWLGAALRATLAIHTFVHWYFFNLLPSISRCAHGPPEQLHQLMRRSIVLVAWAGLLCALLTTILAGELTPLAYGAAFTDAGGLLAVLIWSIPLSALANHYQFLLIGFDRQEALLKAALAGLITAIAVTLGGAPIWGAQAAAAAPVAANIVFWAMAWIVSRQVAVIDSLRPLAGPLSGLALAGLALWAAEPSGSWRQAGLACGVYLLAFAWSTRREAFAWLGNRR